MNSYQQETLSPELADLLQTSQELIEQDHAERALAMLSSSPAHDRAPIRNARGVCLMRMGRHEEAMAVLRELYYPNNAFAVPHDTPTEVRANYVAALLLQGNVHVAASLLYNVPDRQHPAVQRLRAAIRAWKRSLPWWGRVLVPLGLYPESAPDLGRDVGWFWFPPIRESPSPGKKVA